MKQSVSASVSVISNNHIFREWSQFHLDKNGLLADYLTPDFLLTNKDFKKNDIFILDVQNSYMGALDSIQVIKKLGAASKVIMFKSPEDTATRELSRLIPVANAFTTGESNIATSGIWIPTF